MKNYDWNLLVGVLDHEEGTDLSTHLIAFGWNVDRCYTAEEVMDALEEADYGLVIVDEESLSDSEWTVEDFADAIPTETRAIILGSPGSVYPIDSLGDRVRVLIRPYSYSTLHSLVETLLMDEVSEFEEEEDEEWTEGETEFGSLLDELEEYARVS